MADFTARTRRVDRKGASAGALSGTVDLTVAVALFAVTARLAFP